LKDAYSFDARAEEHCKSNWQNTDNFFFDNLEIGVFPFEGGQVFK